MPCRRRTWASRARPRGAAARLRAEDVRMGEPDQRPAGHRLVNQIARRGAPGELKHLSTPRKREHSRSSGERTGSSPNPCRAKAPAVAAWGLEARPGGPGDPPRSWTKPAASRSGLERPAVGGESPVGESWRSAGLDLSTAVHVEGRGKRGGPPPKAKYTARPIVHQYREGKVKSTPARGMKEILKPHAHTRSEPA